MTAPETDSGRRLAERYASDAAAYREIWAPVLRRVTLRLLAELPLAGARRVLDVGAGVGAMLPDLRSGASGALVTGVDRTEGMLALADPSFPRCVADARRLPIAGGSFDVAIAVFMLFHMPDPDRALAEMGRVLRPSGAVGTITWGKESTYPALEAWNRSLDAHGAGEPEAGPRSDAMLDAPDKVSELLAEAGFIESRAWTDVCEVRWDPETFLAWRTRMGMGKLRLDTLTPEARASCVARVRERLTRMSGDDFMLRDEVIVATARLAD